jgi:flagella basal body P-ring formation protein FlgA
MRPSLSRCGRKSAHTIRLLVWLALLAGGIQAAAAQTQIVARVAVAPQSTVSEPWIILGRIARIDATEPRVLEQLSKLALANSPENGQTRWLEADTLKQRLQQAGFDLAVVELELPERIAVTRGALMVPVESLRRAAVDYVLAAMPWRKDQVRIKQVQVEQQVLVPAGEMTLRVMGEPNGAMTGDVALTIEVLVDGRPVRRSWATVSIEASAQAVAAVRPLARNQLVSAGDVTLQAVDAHALPAGAITRSADVTGKRLKRAVAAGTLLSTEMVERPPLVKRGDVVTILYESGGLRVTALGIVRQEGGEGERIHVQNADSHKAVYAHVVDSRTVRVNF